MKAVLINKYGHNNVVEIKNLSRPKPGPNEMLIRVRAGASEPGKEPGLIRKHRFPVL